MRSQSDPDGLDDLDLALVRALAEDPSMTNRALAARLHMAESTCAYRLRSLRERGVVRPPLARFDAAALGRPLQAVIRVRLGGHTKAGVTTLFDALVAIPGALQVFNVAGADDFLVYLAVADADELRDVVLERITVHPAVRSTETHLVFAIRDGVGVVPGAGTGAG